MPDDAVKLEAKTLRPHKSRMSAKFDIRNVLTNDPFVYVDLWLRRNHKDDALFLWRQAEAFYRSSKDLTVEAKPLVLYFYECREGFTYV